MSLLNLLKSIHHQGWQYIVTLDEAWFYFSNHHEHIWLPDSDDSPQIPQHMNRSPKKKKKKKKKKKNNADCSMESTRVPFGQCSTQGAEVGQSVLY
jgi:hypothetical protein